MLLVQTPRGTVSLPPQGFFQRQPSPFASQLTPTGLPPLRPPVSLAPRIPAPADLNSASLVQPPAPPPAKIPSSSRFNNFAPKGGFGPAEDAFEDAPVSNPANPNSFDPATAFSVPGGLAFGPLGSLAGKTFGNVISAFNAPPGALNQVNPFSLALNILSPFGLFGESIHEQTQPFKQAVQLLDLENEIAKQQQEQRRSKAFKSWFRDSFPAEATINPVTSPTIGVVDPNVLGIPEDAGEDPSFGGMGEGFGQNAANAGQEDVDEDSPDSPDSPDDPGDPSWICTAAWATGISAPATWSKDRRMLAWIVPNDPDAYAG